jgi:predicted Zn-dependent peptidase
MGWPILGRPEVIQSIKPETVKNYMKRHYGASHMVFAAAGNINHETLVEQVRLHFSSLDPEGDQSFKPAVYQGGDYRQEKELEQVHLILGFEGIKYQDPDFYVASVLSTLLGDGMSSRLFQEIREKRGLVYTIHSSTSSYGDSGHFTIYAGTGPDEVKELLPVVCEQLRLLPHTLTQNEIHRAKSQLKASLMMGLESTSNRCERLANQMLIYGKPVPPTTVMQSIDQVNKEDLARLAHKIFQSKPTLTSLGPIKNLMPFAKVCEQLLI